MVFAFHSIEGYLNFVGEKILPELWKDEKKNFSRTGIRGKLSKICECCGIALPDKGRRPYSTVSELKKTARQDGAPKDASGERKNGIRRGQAPSPVRAVLSGQPRRPQKST
jgi:hypothetical protein